MDCSKQIIQNKHQINSSVSRKDWSGDDIVLRNRPQPNDISIIANDKQTIYQSYNRKENDTKKLETEESDRRYNKTIVC